MPADPTWSGTEWTLTEESATVTAAEAPTNSDATAVPSNYLICDRSGWKVRVDEGLREEWNGLMVRKDLWESRHPQDFVRGAAEELNGSPRPEPDDVYLATNEVVASDL